MVAPVSPVVIQQTFVPSLINHPGETDIQAPSSYLDGTQNKPSPLSARFREGAGRVTVPGSPGTGSPAAHRLGEHTQATCPS